MTKIVDINKAGEDIVKVEENNKAVAKRKSHGKVPQSRAGIIQTDEDRQLVSKLLGEVLVEYKKPRVRSDEELQARFNDYFQHCAEVGQIPTVEEMAMCTGYSQSTVWDWEMGRNKGFSGETSVIVKKAKEFLKTFDAKLVISGKLNFLAYCFRAKNYYGMSDKNEYVIKAAPQDESDYSAEDIAKRYALDDGAVEGEFVD